jgi:hypothetical protein
MARKKWTQEEINALEQRVRDKIKRKEKLTCGETLIWDELKRNKPLELRFVEEVDFMMGFE